MATSLQTGEVSTGSNKPRDIVGVRGVFVHSYLYFNLNILRYYIYTIILLSLIM